MRPGLHVDETSDVATIEGLAEEWSDLWDRCRHATTFQRPEWLLPWLRCFTPHDPWVIQVRDGGRLVGLAPLFVYGTAGQRLVAPLGAGISDYLDLLVDRALEREALDAIFTTLAENHRRWSRVDLEALRPVSPVLRAPLPAGYEDEIEALDVCPVLTVPRGDLRSVVRSRQLSHFRKARRDLEKAGAVRIDVANEQTREELLEALLRLHAARWTALGSTGVLADPMVQRFHREVSAGLLARGVLRLYALRVDGRIVGSVYTFLERDVAYFYLQGFDPEFQWFSPGMQVVGHAIEDAIRQGARSFDFLRGAEAYKYAWGAADQPTFRRRIHNRTWQPA